MARPISVLFLLFLSTLLFPQAYFNRCGAEIHQSELFQKNQSLAKSMAKQESKLEGWIAQNSNSIRERTIITIPVVVHVIWNQNDQNISNDQIFSQIDVLNDDFRALNSEIDEVPSEFQNLIADVEIEFCLAQRDPNGNPTNGITRTFTQAPSILGSKNIHFQSMGGVDVWDPSRYLNIWVAAGGSIAGFGSFPGVDPPEEDGVEINYKHFGTIDLEPPYHLGRTTTHEVGHYLNLKHLFGNDCNFDDMVNDTPTSDQSYLGKCPAHPSNSCGSNDLFMNYLHWTDDACMAMFTKGQKERMLATLETLRPGLINSNGCLPVNIENQNKLLEIKIFPNPGVKTLNIEVSEELPCTIIEFKIFHTSGQELLSETKSKLKFNSLNISTLETGVYFLIAICGEKIFQQKIVIG